MHEPVREDRGRSVDPPAAPEIAELATSFFDEDDERCVVPGPTGQEVPHAGATA